MPYDPHLADLMREALADRHDIQEKKMFGGYCWMLNGNMLCGVEVGRYMFRVGKEQEAEALTRPGTEPVVFNERKMGGIIWVNADECLDAGIEEWISFASNFVGGLPPK
ncbi:MAG: TfoX/Sxy family protein [Methyloligellaceae bacterium]